MAENNVKLVPVADLLGKNFFIPNYQRGYKWTPAQVNDLLDDLDEFMTSSKESGKDDFYCLQPLAVELKSNGENDSLQIGLDDIKDCSTIEDVYNKLGCQWNVIDGQQRLTTIFLILCYLGVKKIYTISYETREGSEGFLSKYQNNTLPEEHEKKANVDYFHISTVYETIKNWFEGKGEMYEKDCFKETLLHKTQFIWYECKEDAISVFTRLNIGKIGLTNAELIKAIILKDENFAQFGNDALLHKLRIAREWDEIEHELQNDEFWMFFADVNYSSPTRIEYLFEIVGETILKNSKNTTFGTDRYKTFRLFDDYLKRGHKLECPAESCWIQIRDLFYVLKEWYQDLHYYHYVGYLIEIGKASVKDLYTDWTTQNKTEFVTALKGKIKLALKDCCKQTNIGLSNLLEQQYEIDVDVKDDKKKSKTSIPKTVCRPILLLHNIESVIRQNEVNKEDNEYDDRVFFRFPFYLFRKRNGNKIAWDVEHIDSNEHNNLKDNFTKLLWLLQYRDTAREMESYCKMMSHIKKSLGLEAINDENILKKKISSISFENENITFEIVADEICTQLESNSQLSQDEKNQIWNFTLLDSHTNRSYGNSIFPEKRRTIAAKDRRMVVELTYKDSDFVFEERYEADSVMDSFIPPVTRNVFMKYYTPTTTDFMTWSKTDAQAYKEDMKTLLSEYLLKAEEVK